MYVSPDTPIVREAITRRAVRIAGDALSPILDAAVASGLPRAEVYRIARGALASGGEGVLERTTAALDQEIEGRA